MGKQMRFLMDIETEIEFRDLILKEGIILSEGSNPNPIKVTTLPEPFSGKGWFKLYLYKEEFGELLLENTTNGRLFVNETQSPVIEFIRTVVREDEKEISRGRLWTEIKYWNEEGESIEKIKLLNDWYASLCKWIKKKLPRTEFFSNEDTYVEFISPSMKKLVEKGYKIL